jgi:hypothetical protein
VKNTGEQLERLGDDRITLRDRWGSAPVLCEGIEATVSLPVAPEKVGFYLLDEKGDRRAPAAIARRKDKTIIPLGPEHKTIWYEAVID